MKRTILPLGCLLWAAVAGYAQDPTITSVLPAFGGGAALCPGGLAQINGSNLGNSVSVTVGGKSAFMNIQPGSAGVLTTFQIPVDAGIGPQTVVLTRTSDQATASSEITLVAVAPALIDNRSGLQTPVGVIVSPRHADGKAVTPANTAKAGETISFAAVGLGPTNPALTTGANPTGAEALAGALALTIGTTAVPADNLTAFATARLAGFYTVNVVIPSGLNGTFPTRVTVAGQVSNSIPLQIGTPAPPVITAITDVAGGSRFCPGGRAVITGTDLGPNPTVRVGGRTAFNISMNSAATSLTIQIPVDAPLGVDDVVLTLGASTPPFPITVTQFAPVLPLNAAAGPNAAQGMHVPSGAQILPSAPVAPGERIGITVFGLGRTNPPLATGVAPTGSAPVVTQPTVSIGGKPATITDAFAPSSGAVASYLIFLMVPTDLPAGDAELIVTIGGVDSNARTIPVSTAPFVTSVVNAASGNAPGLPNAGIAQGAIFLVTGNLLGPEAISVDSTPFQRTSLSGTSVSVTVAGATVSPLMYYTQAGQVAALLPSNTPTGTGAIRVTYNGQTGSPFPITVVANNLGIFTVTSNGEGSGVVTYPDYSLVSTHRAANCGGVYTTCGAANPGDVLTLWGTGLGAVNGKDEDGAGLGVNQTSVPLKIWLGGVEATSIAYQGRSGCCIGEDQIVFTVPANAPTGCAVPLAVQINDQISNSVVIPIAASGRTCTPVNPAFGTTASVPTLGAGPVRYGDIALIRRDNNPIQDILRAEFGAGTLPPAYLPFGMSYLDATPLGTCAAYHSLNGNGDPPLDNPQSLDAGTTMTVAGPGGTVNIQGNNGGFRTNLSSGFLTPGSYTVSFSGGADVPAFSTTVTLPALPTMTSPQPGASTAQSVTRSSGMQVTWTGGSPGVIVHLSGQSSVGVTGASFECRVSADAGSFTIPPYILQAMPPGNSGRLRFMPGLLPVRITTPGLNLAFFNSTFDFGANLTFR